MSVIAGPAVGSRLRQDELVGQDVVQIPFETLALQFLTQFSTGTDVADLDRQQIRPIHVKHFLETVHPHFDNPSRIDSVSVFVA